MSDILKLSLLGGVLLLLPSVIYMACVIIYNLVFHPLAKYPGPFLGKISNLHAAYHAYRGDLHLDMWRSHIKYGKNVRYAPNRLLVNSNAAVNDIYGAKKNVKKSKDYLGMVHQAPNTLTLIDKVEHGRRRRVLSQGFSMSNLHSYEPKILKNVRNMCFAIRRGEVDVPVHADEKDTAALEPGEWSKPIDMSKMSNYFAFDVMADVVFSLDYNMLLSTRWRYVCDSIEASNVRTGAILQAPELKWLRLDKWLFPKAIYGRNKFVRFVGGLIRILSRDRQNKSPDTCTDIFSRLASATDPLTGTGFQPQQIAAESTTLIVAGSDTTSTAISGLLFYLTRHPRIYAKATREIRSKFTSVEDIVMGSTLSSCTYLRACIDETMRISPSVGSALWREVDKAGAVIDGMYIPAGVDVGTGIYSIHHQSDYYPEPFEFRPERWLIGKYGLTDEQLAVAQSAFNPFSLGPRGCIGRSLAIAELQLLMATLLFTFDLRRYGDIGQGNFGGELGRDKPSEFQLFDHVTSGKEGPIIQFRERDDRIEA